MPQNFENLNQSPMGPPSYQQNDFNSPPPSFKSKEANFDLDDDLGLPSVPNDHPGQNQSNLNDQSASFDDLTKRFLNLKNSK